MIFFFSLIILITILGFKSKYLGELSHLMDFPEKGKIHIKPIPLLGGPLIFLSLSLYMIFYEYPNKEYFLYFYSTIFFLIGLLDDKKNLKPYLRIFLILIFSIILLQLDNSFIIEKIYFKDFDKSYYFGVYKIPVTLTCMLLLYISMNMQDGINGLVIITCIIALIIFKLLILNTYLSFIDLTLLTVLIILLYFNYNSYLFLGNSGTSLLSGYFIYTLITNNYYQNIDVWLVISLLLIPGLDMVRLFFARVSISQSPLQRDTLHLHHILLHKFKLLQSLIIYIFLCFFPVSLNLLININLLLPQIFCIILYFRLISKPKIQ